MKKYTTAVVWFRNDLRLHDNEALARAARDAEFVVPVYCFDPRHFATTSYGFPKTGSFRAQFIRESVEDIQHSLQKLGGNLLVRTGKPEEIVPELMKQCSAQALYFHEEATDEEIRCEERLTALVEAQGASVHSYWSATLFHLDDIPFDVPQLPDVFTQFRKTVEKKSEVRVVFPVPETISLPAGIDFGTNEIPTLAALGVEAITPDTARGVLPYHGGETAARKRLQEYIWNADCLKNYKETRNGLVGANYSSKFSAWLAAGCISPRFIYDEVKRYERERVANDSTYWLIFELLWRDFFRFTALKYDAAMFRATGIMNVAKPSREDPERFERWKLGRTGIPFIDASMRELLHTGFMSNRGRQNVASFLVRDLNIPWLMGAEWFESVLVDYDVCSNYGNWNYAAGIGNDPREDRYFNIIRQASMYDPQGDFVRHWLPELKNVPNAHVHEPHKMTIDEQKRYDCRIGVDFPQPVVNLEKTSKAFQRPS
jgi:deoxyribodipyrimidine photo-lyase